MIRFLLILFLVFFLVFKLFGWIFRLIFQSSGQANQRYRQHKSYTYRRKPKDSNVNIDYVPPKKKKDFKDGEYVDYEEL